MNNNSFLPSDFFIIDWNSIEPYFIQLDAMPLSSEDELNRFLQCKTELEMTIDEDQAWRYIRFNIDTRNEAAKKAFEYFIDEVEPKVESWFNRIDRKLADSESFRMFEQLHVIPARLLKKNIEIFREENLQIFAELQKEEQEYGAIMSEIAIEINDNRYTLQQAAELLQENDRSFRELVYWQIFEKRVEKSEVLNELLSKLLRKRYKIAINAGYKNFRDYQHFNLGRFDYTVEDIQSFHNVIASEVNPIVEDIMQARKDALGVERLKPWDLQVDIEGKKPLRPFSSNEILTQKAIECFTAVNPDFANIFTQLDAEKLLDLDSRFGKAPGGFNYPLHKSNRSFIFMNATGSMNDFETLMHEGGHAFHAYYYNHWPLIDYMNTPSEIAELASMSMELISMEHWGMVLTDTSELKRAKRKQLEGSIIILAWIAAVDKFQHWLYMNPEHSHHERDLAWTNIYREFSSHTIDWEGAESAFVFAWQRQLHIFEMPFYYIEYAFAQLGAIAIWKNYRQNPKETLDKHIKMMKLGYSRPLPELYKEAGIEFSFTKEYLSELMFFAKNELSKLY
ncbi:MAG: M3 family oligoendopeptidase [Bacteroidales bacterium]|nr:MAG: M3 family oligoendopeptidase [Bacteroidales bacterium]